MTVKILKANSKLFHRSTYCALTPDELSQTEEIKSQEVFDASVHDKLGSPMTSSDLTDNVQTPHYDMYEDDDHKACSKMCDADDITPKSADQYINAEVLLQQA